MCYVGPVAGAIVTSFIWSKKRELKIWWLNLMFYGGALFGIIDHLYNGELFLISKNWIKDLGLGVMITVGIILTWITILALAKRNSSLAAYLKTASIR